MHDNCMSVAFSLGIDLIIQDNIFSVGLQLQGSDSHGPLVWTTYLGENLRSQLLKLRLVEI